MLTPDTFKQNCILAVCNFCIIVTSLNMQLLYQRYVIKYATVVSSLCH